ncbi:uncharacterized protein LOC125592670 [Brassica napus]|uniref:uncharacterized protein LOC125592670 n=3 Tax=Brassica napus TaxID=3708 RepID=UPI00207A35A8|nr:uncharacterized protein LOC125592670 [Brassica napus]
MEVLCICGQWISKESLQWEFLVDLKSNASIISIEEDLLYEDLMKIVSEEFSVKEEEISLSYGNTRQLRTFISKTRAFDGTCRLCVKVSTDPASCNTQASDTFASTVPLNANPVILSTVQREKQVSTDPASCNTQASDTFASTVPLNANLMILSTVQREKQSLLYEGVSTVPLNALPDFSPVHIGLLQFSTDPASCVSTVPLNALPDFSPVHIGLSPTTRGAGDIKVNSYFKTKRELMLRMKKWALEWKFEYKTVSSNKLRVLLSCVDENCTWRMRAIKLPLSDFFVVKKYVHEHTCDTTHRKANHRQASAKLLGSLICSNYGEKKEGLKPKQIIEQVRMLHGVHINYKQAWRVREEAQILVRGTPEDSYYNLSRWLYKITETNPGSLTYQHVDAAGKFKYAFVAFGPSIRGFSLMRRVIAVDGTFLKGKFNGTLLAACAQDGNYHLYPLAFAVVDAENGASWKWFFRGLSQKIPDASDLVFVSDRANSISSALEDVYPLSHHGICRIHLLRNITPTYAKTGLLPLVESAADAYTCHEFWLIFKDIKDKCPELAKYLEDSDFRKWARSYAPANRYNIMTTNIAESLNSMLRMPRELPIISLLETIRLTMTTWFFERREAAAKHKHLVTPKVVQKLVSRLGAAMLLNVYQVDRSEFEVKNETMKFVVDLEKRHCTCNVFDIDKIPCIHAIAAAKHIKRDENLFVDASHLTETWAKAYAESIHPGGELSTSTYPENIDELSCPPPATKKKSGRPPTKRKRSVGEFGVPGSKSQSHKCSRCGTGGHNKSTCERPIG